MDLTNIQTLDQANSIIDDSINDPISNQGNTINLGKPQSDEEKKLSHRKELKKHYKKLAEKCDKSYDEADKHDEKGDRELSKKSREMGKKYREMAKKLAAEMDEDGKEINLSDYPIDEAALSNPDINGLQLLRNDMEVKMQQMQNSIISAVNAQLSGIAKPDVEVSVSKQELISMRDLAAKLLGDK